MDKLEEDLTDPKNIIFGFGRRYVPRLITPLGLVHNLLQDLPRKGLRRLLCVFTYVQHHCDDGHIQSKRSSWE